ncbi:MAG: sugar phosphorylase [Planctomycetaceae bacterium]|nr:sugar phosphorylase [Planctomycetaceae bacterium]
MQTTANMESEEALREGLRGHLSFLYPEEQADVLCEKVLEVFSEYQTPASAHAAEPWTESDCLLITYGNSVIEATRPGLQTLWRFLRDHIGNLFSGVHVLPFNPYSSDDGFAVIDYEKVNPRLGGWPNLIQVASEYRLMADLVINHVSGEHAWFRNYCAGLAPGDGYFIEMDPSADLSEVIRPRTTPLLRPTETRAGLKHVWCTFSHDQVDVNFANPKVLLEYLKIIRLYLDRGISIFRLDAVGFLWKEPGTTCIHLPQTHEVIRLIRRLTDFFAPGTLLITETNVPNLENLSYFGNRNEAHIVYNFSLAPLLVHALLTGETSFLKRWMMSMPPAPVGCTYLNFTASHDGIGMRPAEGLLSDEEQRQMVEVVRQCGGRFSTRRSNDGGEKIYELNVSLFDVMKQTIHGVDEWQVERFLCSQTVMMAIEGIPAFYIHSLVATPNDYPGLEQTGQNRSINRRKLDITELEQHLSDSESNQSRVFAELKRRLSIRCRQPAFHPNATQFTLQLAPCYFAFWRQSMDRTQSIFAVHNLTGSAQELRLTELNLISLDAWHDLLSGIELNDHNATLTVRPYQCLWITNRPTDIT